MKHQLYMLAITLLLCTTLSAQSDLMIKKQTSGPFNVNSYLLYDMNTKEAVFIDAGIDSLSDIVEQAKLKLKYIFLTHAHQDHIIGLNALKKRYPKAKVCFSKEEFQDFRHYMSWDEIFDTASVDGWKKDTVIVKLMNFDYKMVKKPDIYLDNDQEYKIGNTILKVIKTPGHSRGSLTFSIANMIFPGDLIVYHATGDLDYFLCSKDEIVKSIRMLYKLFPDETIIHSGHGKSSTIGYEKTNNKNVSETKTMW
jgi:glyoxylase-like metal-dependent hydrolase (beta-lactamase superfamily II)